MSLITSISIKKEDRKKNLELINKISYNFYGPKADLNNTESYLPTNLRPNEPKLKKFSNFLANNTKGLWVIHSDLQKNTIIGFCFSIQEGSIYFIHKKEILNTQLLSKALNEIINSKSLKYLEYINVYIPASNSLLSDILKNLDFKIERTYDYFDTSITSYSLTRTKISLTRTTKVNKRYIEELIDMYYLAVIDQVKLGKSKYYSSRIGIFKNDEFQDLSPNLEFININREEYINSYVKASNNGSICFIESYEKGCAEKLINYFKNNRINFNQTPNIYFIDFTDNKFSNTDSDFIIQLHYFIQNNHIPESVKFYIAFETHKKREMFISLYNKIKPIIKGPSPLDIFLKTRRP